MRKRGSRAQNGDSLQGGAQVFQGHLGPTYVYLSYLGQKGEEEEKYSFVSTTVARKTFIICDLLASLILHPKRLELKSMLETNAN